MYLSHLDAIKLFSHAISLPTPGTQLPTGKTTVRPGVPSTHGISSRMTADHQTPGRERGMHMELSPVLNPTTSLPALPFPFMIIHSLEVKQRKQVKYIRPTPTHPSTSVVTTAHIPLSTHAAPSPEPLPPSH